MTLDLTTWSRRAERGATQDIDYADRLLAEADAAEMLAIRARQAANRHAAYQRRRPLRYATAAYANLRPWQDPAGLISAWWDRGPRSLLLSGPCRTGKTYAAYAITNAVNAHSWVVAVTAADLSAALKPDSDPAAYDRVTACDLLLLDDLGREKVTDWWLEQLQRIIDDRCGNLRRLVVTTNAGITPDEAHAALSERYGDPVSERFIDGGGLVGIDGPVVREVMTSW